MKDGQDRMCRAIARIVGISKKLGLVSVALCVFSVNAVEKIGNTNAIIFHREPQRKIRSSQLICCLFNFAEGRRAITRIEAQKNFGSCLSC